MASLLYRLGSAAARRPLAFVLAWILVLGTVVGAMALAPAPADQRVRAAGQRVRPGARRPRGADPRGGRRHRHRGPALRGRLHRRPARAPSTRRWPTGRTSRTSPAWSIPSPRRPSSTAATRTCATVAGSCIDGTRGVREGGPPARAAAVADRRGRARHRPAAAHRPRRRHPAGPHRRAGRAGGHPGRRRGPAGRRPRAAGGRGAAVHRRRHPARPRRRRPPRQRGRHHGAGPGALRRQHAGDLARTTWRWCPRRASSSPTPASRSTTARSWSSPPRSVASARPSASASPPSCCW